MFRWKDDSLRKIMDEPCLVNYTSKRTQTFAETNACSVDRKVVEDIGDDNCRLGDSYQKSDANMYL